MQRLRAAARASAARRIAVEEIVTRGGLPVVLGGDHSITAPVVEAMAALPGAARPHVVQFDAHLDFVDVRHGVRYGHGNCMKRCSEMAHVSGLTPVSYTHLTLPTICSV